jgi:MFS family permease
MIGVLSAQFINWRIALLDDQIPAELTNEIVRQSWVGQYGWRWMFGVEAIPAVFFFILMIFMPESVRWLVKDGQLAKAEKILNKIGGPDYGERD